MSALGHFRFRQVLLSKFIQKFVKVTLIINLSSVHDDVKFGGNLAELNTRIMVWNTGKNFWMAPLLIQSKCNVDISYFPFDTQECHLTFGSSTHDILSLNITEDTRFDTSMYIR